MARVKWDQIGEHLYEAGCDHGVLYPQKNGTYPKGVAWNGLTEVAERPSGAEDNPQYADNIKYLNIKSAEDFGATINCFYYPDEWCECNGEAELVAGVTLGQQRRNTFGLSYRTKIGNDTDGEDHGYKIHLVYGGSATPSEKTYSTINDNPEVATFSYEITTTPVDVPGKDKDGNPFKPTALIVIDSRKVDAEKLKAIEDILYGVDEVKDPDTSDITTPGTEPRLPLPAELIQILAAG